MQIGAMNNPQRDPLSEIQMVAGMGLDFIDLTLEPPAAAHRCVDARRIREALQREGLAAVGHTPYYLPIGNPYESLRRAAVEELRQCLRVFAEIGVSLVNVHPDRWAPMHKRDFVVARNRESLAELLEQAERLGQTLMLENIPGGFNNSAELGELLDPLPQLGLHLDIGHANLRVAANTAPQILRAYGRRLRHVHLHDNTGNEDLHLPIGAGTMDLAYLVGCLRSSGYDGTITLEVFSPDRQYLAHSRDLLRGLWERSAPSPGCDPEGRPPGGT